MRSLLKILISTCGATLSFSALAADMPVKAPAPAAVVASNWTGIYVGAHAGGAWSHTDWTFNGGGGDELFRQHASSWIAGGQVGYLYQLGNIVVGIEASFSGTDLDETTISTLVPNRSRTSKISDLWTVTGRLGYAWDRWLAYIKGGYANGTVQFDSFLTDIGNPLTTSKSREDGWTAGAGWEYAVSQNVSLALEYDFYRLSINNRDQFEFPGIAASTVTNASADIHAVTGRFNFRFNPS